MSPIRILQIINSVNIGGAETMLLNLLDGLNSNHFETGLCVIGKSPLGEEARLRGVEVKEIPPYKSKKDFHFLLNLARTIHRLRPDVVQAHIWFTNLYSCLCGKMLGIPVISTFHSNHSVETLFERLSIRTIYHFSKRVVMVSDYQIRHFGFSSRMRKISVIMNGVRIFPLNEMSEEEMGEIKNEQLGVGNGDKIITYVSNLRPVKGHIFLLQAFRLVLKECKDTRLILIGDGPLGDELIKKSEEYGIRDKVRFLGFRDDVMDLLSVTDVFVHPSLSEANSIAIMEAMAMGRPVIAANVGGNLELINDGNDGILVSAGDPEALAERIILLLKNRGFAAELGRNARSKIMAKFNVDQMVKSYEKLYYEIKNG